MTARHASASVPVCQCPMPNAIVQDYLPPASGILSACLPKRDVGWKAGGLSCVTVRAGNLPLFVTNS